MNLEISPRAKKQLANLPVSIQKKAKRQFGFLLVNYRYPSLRTRKMQGIDLFEARIDIRYRFTFQIIEDAIYVLSAGPHDEGLGKK